MTKLMLSCKKASELIDKQDLQKLRVTEKVQLAMHTSMCKGCQAYSKQSGMLNILIRKMANSEKIDTEDSDTVVTLKNKIIKKIEEQES